MENFFKIKEKLARTLIKKSSAVKNNYFLVKKTEHTEFKVIISVRKKFFKKAVVRNRIKRIIREIIRNDVTKCKDFYLIIVSNRFDLNQSNLTIRQKLLELI